MHDVTRRQFITTAGLIAAAPLLSCSRPDRHENGRRKRVVVLGAGLAGLAAAESLRDAGLDVEILEARTRPGGRVKTLRAGFADGLHVEAGAMWVPSNHRTLRKHLERHRIELAPAYRPEDAALKRRYFMRNTRMDVSPDGWRCTRDGREVPFPLNFTRQESEMGFAGMRRRYILDAVDQVGNPRAAGWPSKRAKDLDALTFADLLRRRGASDDAVAFLKLGIYDDWGDGAEHVSALCILRDEFQLAGSSYDIVKFGADLLPRAMANALDVPIRYGHVVTRLEQDGNGVAVVTEGPQSRVQKHVADAVICTIPYSVLKDIDISPALPPDKRKLIDGLGYTSIVRVLMQTRRRFWSEQGFSGDVLGDSPIQALVDSTRAQPGRRGVLSTYTAADPARRLSGMSEDDRAAFAIAEAERIFPGARNVVEKTRSVIWDDDPYARGAFAWFKPGELTASLDVIARPEGLIHFAGEHTSPCPGWMEGALLSGERAARDVVSSL